MRRLTLLLALATTLALADELSNKEVQALVEEYCNDQTLPERATTIVVELADVPDKSARILKKLLKKERSALRGIDLIYDLYHPETLALLEPQLDAKSASVRQKAGAALAGLHHPLFDRALVDAWLDARPGSDVFEDLQSLLLTHSLDDAAAQLLVPVCDDKKRGAAAIAILAAQWHLPAGADAEAVQQHLSGHVSELSNYGSAALEVSDMTLPRCTWWPLHGSPYGSSASLGGMHWEASTYPLSQGVGRQIPRIFDRMWRDDFDLTLRVAQLESGLGVSIHGPGSYYWLEVLNGVITLKFEGSRDEVELPFLFQEWNEIRFQVRWIAEDQREPEGPCLLVLIEVNGEQLPPGWMSIWKKGTGPLGFSVRGAGGRVILGVPVIDFDPANDEDGG